MSKFIGRKEPYTVIGLSRLKCCRCKEKKARYQWNCCANGNRWLPICLDCDIALNETVLRFFNFARRKRLMADYKEKVGTDLRLVS